MRNGTKLLRAALASVFLLFIFTGLALAVTISVDGTRESAWDGEGSVSDPDEAISNEHDITRVQWTNDSENFYWLIETYDTTNWLGSFGDDPYIYLCINNDNDTGTGSSYSNCPGGIGYDSYVRINGGSSLSVDVFDENGQPVSGASTSVSTNGVYTEVGVDLASLGFTESNCSTAPTGLYFDNRTTDNDDNVEDTQDATMYCDWEPTAITLTNVTARSNALYVALGIAAVGVVGLLGTVVILRRRRA